MERICAERIIERLRLEYAGRAKLDAFFWEHEPMRATASFADPENIPPTAEFDIVVCILWARLGTMLSRRFKRRNGEPYPSGTAYEIETAVESYLARKAPDIMVYRRTQAVPMPVNDPAEAARRAEQLAALNAFIQKWFYDEDSTFKAAINEYSALGQFETKLERPLRKLIVQHIESAGVAAPAGALPVTYHGENPFRGLAAYDFADADIFFGRSQAIEDVLTAMRQQADAGRTFTLVHGASGSGKSSLLRAGVIPMMTHTSCAIEGVGCWRVATMTPGATGDDLVPALAASLTAEGALPGLRRLGLDADRLVKRWLENPEGAIAPMAEALGMAAQEVAEHEALPQPPPTKLVLLVDQLEQVFSDDRRFPHDQRKAFAAVLALLARSGVIWIVATIRSDQLATFTEDLPELAELAQGGQVALLPPTETDLDLMIRMPARAAGVYFEEDPATGDRLEARLLRDARSSPDGLPLLSFVLQELYARRESVDGVQVMTHAQLDALGGLEGAVKERAEAIYQMFVEANPSVRDPLAQLARALVTLGRGKESPALRRSAPLALFQADKDGLGKLVDALVDGRLLTRTAGDGNGGVVYVTHEALLRKWTALAEAIEANRAFLTLRAAAATSATDWQERGRAAAFLWDRGERLKDARSLAAEADDLDELEREFVRTSIRTAGTRGKTRSVVAGAAVAAVVGALVWNAQREKEVEEAVESIVTRDAELNDLEEQLAPALTALATSVWEERPAGRQPDTFPALAVAEIARRILALDPENAEAFRALVIASVHDESSPRSAEEHAAAIADYFTQWKRRGLPRNELLNLEAQIQWKKGNAEEAIASWTKYLLTPDLDDTTRRGLLQRVSGHYLENEKWAELERLVNNSWSWEDNAVAKIRRARARMELLKLDLAEKDYQEARDADPDLDEVIDLGPPLQRLLAHRGELESATAALAEESAKSSPEPWMERARVLLVVGRPEQALADIEKAGKIMNGKSTVVEFFRAIARQRANMPAPEGNRVVSLLAFSYADAGFEEWVNRDWNVLMELLTLDKVAQITPNSVATLVDRSRNWYYFIQWNFGLADAEAALAIAPSDYAANYWRGTHLLGQERFSEALEISQTLFGLNPNWIEHFEIRAQAEFGLGNSEAAVNAISQAISAVQNAYYHELRAKFLRKLGRTNEAETDEQTARRLRDRG